MLVLGIETSTRQASVSIGSGEGVVASALVARRPNYVEFLLPAIEFCLDGAGLVYNDVEGIAVSRGPGLLTGLRVGVATAKALAQALSLPIVGMASLDLLAYELRYSPKTICAMLDARRGEVYYALYRTSPGGIQRMSDYILAKPEQLALGIAARSDDMLLVGNGALLYREVFVAADAGVEIGTVSDAFPNAVALVELAAARMMRRDFDSLTGLNPMYLRRSARPIEWDRMRGRRPA
ncbi:MAG: tRNA (adenosine(37)-N6)-threonylcarbamoyltransferase complex dimerization subunit type 1 TsaB [Actinomycetota bacterium]|nr:tRNA (adenosine(37)-N6)-threonylcarbamoyltransferase complex dimerization subunit type 1 TsaB [Actinomycetota bacterium]